MWVIEASVPGHHRVEKGWLDRQKEGSQQKTLRDIEDRVQSPKLHLNILIKRKNKAKHIFKDEMDGKFLKLQRENAP